MVYGAALERRFVGNCIEGSNPSLSAKNIIQIRPVPLKRLLKERVVSFFA